MWLTIIGVLGFIAGVVLAEDPQQRQLDRWVHEGYEAGLNGVSIPNSRPTFWVFLAVGVVGLPLSLVYDAPGAVTGLCVWATLGGVFGLLVE